MSLLVALLHRLSERPILRVTDSIFVYLLLFSSTRQEVLQCYHDYN